MPFLQHIRTRLRRLVRKVVAAILRDLAFASFDYHFIRAYIKLILPPAAVLSLYPLRFGPPLP